MKNFVDVRDRFRLLCRRWGVPEPSVEPALPTDPCDFTDGLGRVVRLNVEAAPDVPAARHAAHVFGHYLACLHCAGDHEGGDAGLADLVADVIADMAAGPPTGGTPAPSLRRGTPGGAGAPTLRAALSFGAPSRDQPKK